MDTTTVVAESSSAPEAVPEIPRSGTAEYSEWRKSGTFPEPKPIVEDSAPSDAGKAATSDIAGDSDTPTKQQEKVPIKRKELTAEERIAQLESTIEKIRKGAPHLETKKAESSPARVDPPRPAVPQTYEEWNKVFNVKDWQNKYATEHPEAEYEDIQAATMDFKLDARDHFRSLQKARSEAQQRFGEGVAKAREQYPDFDAVADPMAAKINELILNPQINDMLKKEILDPEGAHILYALGKDQEIVEKFGRLALNDPAEAIYLWKSLKKEALRELSTTGRNDKGQFASRIEEKTPAPAKRGPESAPEPPLEIGNRGTGPMDESARALSAMEKGNPNAFRDWKRAEDAKEMRRRRGA